jgi:hypothetical protein
VGAGHVALILGTQPNQVIAIASIAGGRLLRRLESTRGKAIDNMTTLPDARSIFFASEGSIWSVPVEGGEPRKLGIGDSVAADPSRSDLIVRVTELESARLVRLSPSGAILGPIPVGDGTTQVAPGDPLNPRAIHPDGRILLTVTVGTLTWPAGILDPGNGRFQLVQVGYPADMPSPGWSPDGKVVTVAAPFRSSLWRFRLDLDALAERR